MKIFIGGDSGLLGQALVRFYSQDPKNKIIGISSRALTPSQSQSKNHQHEVFNVLTEKEKLKDFVLNQKPALIYNCIALTNLTECEQKKDLAQSLNADLAGFFGSCAAECEAQYIHISTDQVYGGSKTTPFKETDGNHPLNNYGVTKLAGEKSAVKENPNSLVIRTNIVGYRDWPGSPTFAEWICGALSNKEPITLFDDYTTSSIHVDLFCPLIDQAVSRKLSGIYNLASVDAVSKYEFGQKLAGVLNIDFSAVKKSSMKGMSFTPERPSYLALDCKKMEDQLLEDMPSSIETIFKVAEDCKRRGASK